MKQWQLISHTPEKLDSLTKQLGISPLIACLLINRGFGDPDKAHQFLSHSLKDLPNPFLLKDMDRAVARLVTALEQKEKIVIYGDYDVDGTSATSLLMLFFRDIGYPVEFYIPHRINEGYSLNVEALRRLKDQGVHLLITVDNGIAASKEVAFASEIGLDLIVTDHHEVPKQIPGAYAVINPLREGCLYPGKEICGTGVAFNLAMALRQRLREQGYFGKIPEPNLKKYLDLVALATVADVVPLIGVNRIFVKAGLHEMTTSQRPGIKALKEVSGIDGEVAPTHLGFRLGPRVNACGRLYDASTGVQLLISENDTIARKLAYELDSANRERQVLEDQILKEAISKLTKDPKTPHRMSHVLYDEKWHPGVIGIVASRLVSRYHRPTVILGKDEDSLKGSARTAGGLNLVEALRECEKTLIRCGGHKAAAGLSLTFGSLESFCLAFEESVRKRISKEDCIPKLFIDAELTLSQVNLDLIEELNQLAPYGQGNPEPFFSIRETRLKNNRVVGKNHLKFKAEKEKEGVNAIAFNMADRYPSWDTLFDLVFSCELNSYLGKTSVVMNIKDLKPTS